MFSFSFSATVTSGEEDDLLACSVKTVIRRPTKPKIMPPSTPPRFYLAPIDNPAHISTSSNILPITPSPIIQAPLPVLMFPLPSVNLAMHNRAHTDTDLVFYNQQPLLYPVHWYSPSALVYPNQNTLPSSFLYGSSSPSFVMHSIPQQQQQQQQQIRSSSADCRRTANNGGEHHVLHSERVW